MKKLIYIFLLIPFFCISQTTNGTETKGNAFRALSPQTVTSSSFITTTGTDGTQGKILGENITLSVIPPVHHFTPITTSIKGYFQGVDDALGNIPATTAGTTSRLWYTADQTTIGAGTFHKTNFTGKGIIASASQSVVNDDNQKKYFTQDLIGEIYATITTFPKGIYAGNLSVSVSPNSAQQRFTVEVYRTDTNGTPIASGITGAVVGDLGVTVVAILDSTLLNLADAAVTNVPVSGILDYPFTVNVGERVRYHISAEKVGTAASNITETLYFGTSYNSYLDVPVPLNTSSIQNLSTVSGLTATEALNTLNSGKQDLLTNPITGIGTANYLTKWSSTSGQTVSIIQDNGTVLGYGGVVDPNIKHNFYSNNNTAYTVTSSGSLFPSSQFLMNNGSNTNSTTSLLRFSASNGNTQSGQVYLGVLNTSTDFESVFVFGRRTSVINWAESMRIHASGGVSIGNQTDGGAGSLNVTGGVTGASFVKSGGLSTQKLLADGSVDSNLVLITITTSVSITTATTDSNSVGQNGRHVVIDNGVNAINITCNGGITTSYGKIGTGAITFIQGSGRTLVQMNGTAILNGAVGSTATLWSNGTTDYLAVTNY